MRGVNDMSDAIKDLFPQKARPYTVVYALSRTLWLKDHGEGCACGCKLIPQERECYHHVARVTAVHVHDAIARCRQDALPGFEFHTIAAFDGDLAAAATGKEVSVHVIDEEAAP